MRKIVLVLALFLLSLMVVLAQQPGSSGGSGNSSSGSSHKDDHDDRSPVQSGYAVVTPVSSTTSGLVVFETFGLRRGEDTTQAGVVPPALTTNAVMFVESDGRLSKNLGVAMVNPNSTNVNVTVTLRKADGTTLGTATVNVPARQQVSKFVTEMFKDQSSVPSNFTGTLSITCPSAISVIGLRFRGSNFSTLAITNLSTSSATLPSLSTGVGGSGAVLLPQFAAGGGWASEIVIVNPGSSSLTVRVDLFKQDGTALSTGLNNTTASSFTNIVIPANGVYVLAPRNADGDDDF